MRAWQPVALVVFDLDGTLLDSDEALASAFVALGVDREAVTFGHVLADECARLGIRLADYLDVYDESRAMPFEGVADLLSGLRSWAVCSNKHPRSGAAELARLGWEPRTAWFADRFDGPKRLGPLIEALAVDAASVAFVGDTDHDRRCAREVGCRFVLAGWNPRSTACEGDLVAMHPLEVVDLLGLGRA